MIVRFWDTGVQNYPTTENKMKCINCSAWPFLYFLFTADGWNFCATFLSPWTKNIFFLFFKILIRYWNTRVQIYLTSACKIFGVARKREHQRKNAPIGAQKRLTRLKQKYWSNRGFQLPQPGALSTASTFPYSSKNSSAEYMHTFYTFLRP